MPKLNDKVPIPPKDTMNTGLSPAKQSTMLKKFGKPGALTKNCSPPTGKFKKRVKSGVDIGPFKVSGLDFAVESLRQIFAEVQVALPEVFSQVKNDGMLCVRHRRKSTVLFSNHSFGCAIDIFFGQQAVGQGVHLTHRGNFLLFPFFNRHGWYWGAEFSGDFVDSMHFELAEETILKLPDTPL
jgi:D-alanyl-D-alanine carboxypeptidase-like protein